MDLDRRRFVYAQHLVSVEVGLLDTADLERDCAVERGGDPEDDRALDLRLDDIGIDHNTAIDRADDAPDTNRAILRDFELQAALNPAGERKVERFGWTFAPGDKVMQIENDYDKEVYNGDIGYIDDVDPEAGEVRASFDGRSVTYGFGELDTLVPAYAATIHKSQGSEYPAVIIPVLTQHYAMLQRNLLYTGVTRGKRLVVRQFDRRVRQSSAHRLATVAVVKAALPSAVGSASHLL